MAVVFEVFMTTVPGTLAPPVTVSVNVPGAVAELIVAGFIGCVKVAANAVPVTTLLLLLVLVGTFVPPLLGNAEPTVGSVAAAPGVPAAPGPTAAPAPAPPLPPPPPHPATKAASSTAMIHPCREEQLWNLFIGFPVYCRYCIPIEPRSAVP